MLQVAIGAILLICGMVGLLKYPLFGIPAIIAGYAIINSAPKGAASLLQGAFFGLAVLGMGVLALVGIADILF